MKASRRGRIGCFHLKNHRKLSHQSKETFSSITFHSQMVRKIRTPVRQNYALAGDDKNLPRHLVKTVHHPLRIVEFAVLRAFFVSFHLSYFKNNRVAFEKLLKFHDSHIFCVIFRHRFDFGSRELICKVFRVVLLLPFVEV